MNGPRPPDRNIDTAAAPYLDGARAALADGFVSGGTRRNLEWVRPHLDAGLYGEDEQLLLADAQTSGRLLWRASYPAGVDAHMAVSLWSPPPGGNRPHCGRETTWLTGWVPGTPCAESCSRSFSVRSS